MSGREFKPGDVATVVFDSGVVFAGVLDLNNDWTRIGSDADPHWLPDDERVSFRPLVVIDPEDREQVERLMYLYCTEQWGHRFDEAQSDRMQAALRELADPKPPKPEEPTGLGAVVEDKDGELYVRHGSADLDAGVAWCDSTGVGHSWDRINVVRVLSEGVQAGDPR